MKHTIFLYKKMILIALFCFTPLMFCGNHTVDFVIFSYNRAIQLYAFLESVEKYVAGVGVASIIYRADTDAHKQAYQVVKDRFPSYNYRRQGANPRADFKALTLQLSFNTGNSSYIVYGVDDIVVKDYCDLADCAQLLEKHNAYAFYLRLGTNLNYCYSLHQNQPVPLLQEVDSDVFAWHFRQGTGDWGYPHSVDMTIVRKSDIISHFTHMSYYSPNTLEERWSSYAHGIMHKTGLCYGFSKIVNFPLNLVQHDWNNRHMSEYTADQLLTIFNQGQKIDIEPIHQMNNSGAHSEYSPTFIAR